MKLPSIEYLFSQTRSTIRRFPATSLITIIGTFLGISLLEAHSSDREWLARIFLACMLGLSLSIAATLHAERWTDTDNDGAGEQNGIRFWAVQIVILLLVGLYAWGLFKVDFDRSPLPLMRWGLLTVAGHFAVAVAPYIGRGSLSGFWQYNATLFIRICTAVVYSAVLYAGLAVALASLDALFDIRISGDSYGKLFVLIAGLFNTFFFISGIPRNFVHLEQTDEYPLGLKIFTQYVLIPLVSLYLLILYAYTFKILLAWQLPNGWVSWLILGFSVTGILALLLVYPVRNKDGNAWIPVFSKLYYLALLPLVGLLFIAIGRRLFDYGFTEPRYWVFLLACWLAAISLYFNFSKQPNIKLLPLTLCLLLLFAAWGPWGGFAVSRRSQQARLGQMLAKNDLLDEQGKVRTTAKKVLPEQEQIEIRGVMDYLSRMHGDESLQLFFAENLTDMAKKDSIYQDPLFAAKKALGVEMGSYPNPDVGGESIYYSHSFTAFRNIKNYDIILNNINADNAYSEDNNGQMGGIFSLNEKKYQVHYSRATQKLSIQTDGQTVCSIAIADTTRNWSKLKYEPYNMPDEKMAITASCSEFDLKLFVNNMQVIKKDSSIEIQNFDGDLLVGFKK